MAQALGSKGRLIIQEESTFKVTPAADAQLVYFKNESLRLSRNLISSETIIEIPLSLLEEMLMLQVTWSWSFRDT